MEQKKTTESEQVSQTMTLQQVLRVDGAPAAPAEGTGGAEVPQVFLLRLEKETEENALESLLKELAGRPVPPIAFLGQRVPALARITGRRDPTVPFIVVADHVPPHDARLAELLGLGVGVVAVTTEPGAGG